MTRDEALAYFTPHPLTKGPVMLDPEKMWEAVAVLQGASPNGVGLSPSGPSPSVSSAAAASIPRAELEAIIRQHIRCDASGLAPAVASVFLCGFEDATDAIVERLGCARDERRDGRDDASRLGAEPASPVDGACDGEAADLIDELDDAASVLRSNDAPYCADVVDQAAQTISDLMQERDALREALKPLAEETYNVPATFSDEMFFGVKVGDLRRARTLLSQSSEGE